MSIKKIAESLGIAEYPEMFDEIYCEIEKSMPKSFDEAPLRALEESYGLFGEHYADVVEGARALFEDKELALWIAVICEHAKRVPKADSTNVPFPEKEGAAADMMRLFPLLALIPKTDELFTAHGFSHEEISGIMRVFQISLRLSKETIKRPGLTKTYYGWTRVYLFCEMFDYGSFNFQFRAFANKAVLLKNIKSGEFELLVTEGKYHKSGRFLGDAGFLDEDGAFDVTYEETDSAFIGYPAIDNVVSSEKKEYSKSQWALALKEGDDVISLHIPRNVDFSDEAIDKSIEEGVKIAKARFPEYNPKFVMCSSWLLDPGLEALLGESSRIVKFGKRFLRFSPQAASNGFGGFSFAFLGYDQNDLDSLPEDTSLRRKLKAHYKNGGYTYFYPGIIAKEI